MSGECLCWRSQGVLIGKGAAGLLLGYKDERQGVLLQLGT